MKTCFFSGLALIIGSGVAQDAGLLSTGLQLYIAGAVLLLVSACAALRRADKGGKL